jgi:hypothetical protein
VGVSCSVVRKPFSNVVLALDDTFITVNMAHSDVGLCRNSALGSVLRDDILNLPGDKTLAVSNLTM